MSSPIWKHSSSALITALLLATTAGVHGRAQAASTPPPQSGIGDQWTTFNGDHTGRRFSSLTQINRDNVKSLQLAWAFQTHAAALKSTPLEVNGVLYFTVPDHTWAVDASTGQLIWQFIRQSEGDHIGQRGVAFYNDRVYVGTPDAHLICLDAKTGKLLWDVTVADVKFGYYISMAPLAINDKIIVGTSGDEADIPHFIEAFDWQTGKSIWKTNVLPDWSSPAGKTWSNERSLARGGGAVWLTGTYDPSLNLIYWGTGNPHPVIAGKVREGDNLYTCSILALNAATGAIVWDFQPSPHDVHDWDADETPILIDDTFNGRPRKLLTQASRNGFFFVLDRVTGEHLLTVPFVHLNWAIGVDAKGRPIADPAKAPTQDGSLIQIPANGGTNWMTPSFDPQTGLFYVDAQQGYSYWYVALDEAGQAADHQGGGSVSLLTRSELEAIDYQTGKVRWSSSIGSGRGSPGILTTAGHLLITGDISGNLLALDSTDGKVLWHTRPGANMASSPMTYELDGHQYIITGVDGVLYAWTLPQ